MIGTPFFEGYKAAALESIGAPDAPLADETLAAMIRDCERAVQVKNGWTPLYHKTVAGGRAFWADRNKYPRGWRTGSGDVWLPVTLSLGDDGKVHAREAS